MERNPKILVVDDDPRLRDLLRRYLGENGFQVFVSENGAAMSRLWVREHFDALILDLMMPGEDGLQILRRLRAAKDMTPVIMLTARGEDVDRIVGLELGADDYIAKPFNPRELLARIHAVLRRRPAGDAPGAPSLKCGDSGKFETFIHNMVDREMRSSLEYVKKMKEDGIEIPIVGESLMHMIYTGFFSSIFQIIEHDIDKEIAKRNVHKLREFNTGGWERLWNVKF